MVATESGEILEPLQASGAWREHRHSLWLRRAFFKAKRQRQLDFAAGQDPIEAFLALRRRQASKSKRASTDIARVQRDRAKGRTALAAETSTSLTKYAEPPLSSEPAPTELQGLATGPVRGKTLRITRGFAR